MVGVESSLVPSGQDGSPGGGVAIVDRDEQPLLYAAAVRQIDEAVAAATRTALASRGHQPRWLLLVDPERVVFWNPQLQQSAEFPAAELVAHYHTEPSPWQITPSLLLTFLEAWLSDLAFGWSESEPPGMAAFRTTGLLDELAGGAMHVIPDDGGSLRP